MTKFYRHQAEERGTSVIFKYHENLRKQLNSKLMKMHIYIFFGTAFNFCLNFPWSGNFIIKIQCN